MSRTVLYILNSETYFNEIISIFKKEIKNKQTIYVTTNKPYSHIINLFKQAGLKTDNIFFIDCISKQVGGGINQEDNCIFIESPQNITLLSIAISESTKHFIGEKTLLLDSLSTLLIYNEANAISQFSNFVINKMRSLGVDTCILAIESDADKKIISIIQTFVDETIKK